MDKGLILYASYPSSSTYLSEQDLGVLVLYDARDRLVATEEVLESKDQLPPDTDWVEINGGNQAGFGWYGEQRGDLPAEISKQDQGQIIPAPTLDFLDGLDRLPSD
jgi:hypothetical protein